MKMTILKEVEINPTSIRVVVPIRRGTKDIPEDFPFRAGDVWDVTIDIATGRIRGWPAGQFGPCYLKAGSDGSYFLDDENGKPLATLAGAYVPDCIPGAGAVFINSNIGPDGVIEDWAKYCTAENIRESFFGTDS